MSAGSKVIVGLVLLERTLPPPLLLVTARVGGHDRDDGRVFGDLGETRRYARDLAQRHGWLLVDMVEAAEVGAD